MHHTAQCWGWPLLLTKLGPPSASWCTMQVSGAQRRLMVHSVALYYCSGAQRRTHKPTQRTGHIIGGSLPTSLYQKGIPALRCFRWTYWEKVWSFPLNTGMVHTSAMYCLPSMGRFHGIMGPVLLRSDAMAWNLWSFWLFLTPSLLWYTCVCNTTPGQPGRVIRANTSFPRPKDHMRSPVWKHDPVLTVNSVCGHSSFQFLSSQNNVACNFGWNQYF